MAKTYSCLLVGVDVLIVEIETVIGSGFSGLNILGLGTETTRDMRERVRSALESIGIPVPARRIVVNITPNEVIKLSRTPLSQLDFAVATSIIYALFDDKEKNMRLSRPAQEFLAGELSLSGELKEISNPLIYEAALTLMRDLSGAGKEKKSTLCLPGANQKYSCNFQSVEHGEVEFFSHLADWLRQRNEPASKINLTTVQKSNREILEEIKVNEDEKIADLTNVFSLLLKNPKLCVAIAIAALGEYHILVAGEPGVGKSFSLQKISHLLLALSEKQKIEVKLIHSSADDVQKPFRLPHHSATAAALVGGSSLKPGEVSLAHHGVLFLDELAEFSRPSLEALREPLDSNYVHLSRSGGTIRYPAHFQLCATTNPCSCGYLFSKRKPCRCNPRDSRKYLQKISGPLLDRFFLQIWVEPRDEAEQPDIFSEFLLTQFSGGSLKDFSKHFISLQKTFREKVQNEEGSPLAKNLFSSCNEEFSFSLRGEKMLQKLIVSFALLFPELKNSANFVTTVLSYRELGNMFTKNSLLL